MEKFAVSPHVILAHSLADTTQRAVIVTDIEGTVLLFNAAAEEWLCYASHEVVGYVNASAFYDATELEAYACALTAELGREISPTFEVISASAWLNQPVAPQWTYIRKDGTQFPALVEVLAARDEAGSVMGFSLLMQPLMTKRDAAIRTNATNTNATNANISAEELAQLCESEAYYRAVVSGMEEGVMLQDVRGVVRTCNASAERMLGLTLEQMNDPYLPGAPWDVVDEDGLPFPPARYPLSTTLHTGQQCSRTVMGVRKPEGELTWLSLNTRPLLLSDQESPALLMSFTDISERKKFETELARTRDAALDSARLKASFLANVSHEIRTPLNGIVGMIDLLMYTPLNAEQQSFLHSLDISAESLLTLIHDLLDLSKLEAGKSTLETAELDVRTLIEDVLDLLAPRAHNKTVEMMAWIDADVPSLLSGDAGRLRQVLMNLLSNATKFTDEGEIVVRVSRRNETALGITLCIEVRDTGIGLSSEAQARVFDPFWQSEDPIARKRTGTGLGLAISRQLVELMGGQIWVESVPSQGSIFTFTVRLQKLSESGEVATPLISHFVGRRALVVDDNATSRKLLSQMLNSWGLSPVSVDGSRDALVALRAATLQNAPFDVVLIDQIMPDVDGVELARTLRSDPLLRGVPCVLLSAPSTTCNDADVCLSKPVHHSRLLRCLESIFAEPNAEGNALKSALDSPISDKISEHGSSAFNMISWPQDVRVLVVEDNVINQQVTANQLILLGCAFDVVEDGRKALEAWESTRYQIVLMDCQLPEMDGYAATEELRRRENARGLGNEPSFTYIIAMTAHAMPEDRIRCLEAGMDDYLSKPVTTSTLRGALERWQQTNNAVPSVALSTSSQPVANGAAFQPTVTPSVIINSEMLEGLRRSSAQGDLLSEMIALFLADAPTRLAAMRTAYEADNLNLVARTAHALSGSCSYFGAACLMAQCAQLEAECGTNNHSALSQTVAGVEAEFARVKDALTEFCALVAS